MKIRKEVHISGLADSKMREAIGAVCVHWSLLELIVERVIANLKGDSSTAEYISDLAHRLDDLKTAAKAHLSAEDSERISEIAGYIKKIKEERHRVAHGLWAVERDGSFVSLFPRDATGNIPRPMDTEEIRGIKLRIWEAHQALKPFADLSQPVVLASPHKRKKQVPPRPALPPDRRAKKNKPTNPQ